MVRGTYRLLGGGKRSLTWRALRRFSCAGSSSARTAIFESLMASGLFAAPELLDIDARNVSGQMSGSLSSTMLKVASRTVASHAYVQTATRSSHGATTGLSGHGPQPHRSQAMPANSRLQRTPSAAPPSPLSRKPFGDSREM